jgi:hypothetical protein
LVLVSWARRRMRRGCKLVVGLECFEKEYDEVVCSDLRPDPLV